MTIKDRVRLWLGIHPNSISVIGRDVLFIKVQVQQIEEKLDALIAIAKVPPASPVIPQRVPLAVLDWEGVTIQALTDLQKEPEKQN